MVVFVLFRLVSSIFPPILGVSTLLHPYSHLSCDHICTSPAGTIHLPVHFHRFFHFSIRISVFQLVLFVLLQPVRSIYPSILAVCGRLHRYTHLSCDHISTFPGGAIRLSIHFHHLGIFYSYFSLSMVIFILLQSV